jgi:hypothetical protein
MVSAISTRGDLGKDTIIKAVLRIGDVYPGSRIVHPGTRIPDPDADFQPIPDPGKKVPDPGTGSATLHKRH